MKNNIIQNYFKNLEIFLKNLQKEKIIHLYDFIKDSSKSKNKIFICGNGGSAANSNHIANDFTYGANKKLKNKINIESLCANDSVITCLANDTGYENIYSEQIKVKGKKNDKLILLSGSGNSMNMINACKEAKKLKIDTFAIVGFDGGKLKKISKNYIHIKLNDMQIAEDMQLILFHLCLKFFWRSN